MNQPQTEDETTEGLLTNNRRQFMAAAGGAAGGLAVGSALIGPAQAQEDEPEEEEEEEPEAESVENDFEDDVAILNYALTLEYLEARFYQQGLDNIGEEALCSCKAVPQDSPLQERLFEELRTIQAHEESHVETLIATIEELDGEPIEEPEFDFGLTVEYPMAFLATAAQLEDVGVSAYAGAAPDIENEDLVVPALGIHSVEARHASFLRTLNNETSYPDVIDEPRSRDEVVDIASQFIVGEEPDEDTEDLEEEGEEIEEEGEEPEEEGEEVEEEGEEDEIAEDGVEADEADDETVGNETDNGADNDTDESGNVSTDDAVDDTANGAANES